MEFTLICANSGLKWNVIQNNDRHRPQVKHIQNVTVLLELKFVNAPVNLVELLSSLWDRKNNNRQPWLGVMTIFPLTAEMIYRVVTDINACAIYPQNTSVSYVYVKSGAVYNLKIIFLFCLRVKSSSYLSQAKPLWAAIEAACKINSSRRPNTLDTSSNRSLKLSKRKSCPFNIYPQILCSTCFWNTRLHLYDKCVCDMCVCYRRRRAC